jgi:pyruvate formate lyase activating enzyme
MPDNLPLIFDIHRFSLDNGPGIRTTVFFKGCPLSCSWCHNPEAQQAGAEMAIFPDRCVQCGSCTGICPEGAITVSPALQIDRSSCSCCGDCAGSCPADAIRTVGKKYLPDELLELILRDRHYFDASGGGVTFSGGEPTLWTGFLAGLLKMLKAENLHIAIQTCGNFAYDEFARKLLPFIDLVMFDLKFMDEAEHLLHTGEDNRLILGNFRRLTAEARKKLLPRVPLVPGITATRGNLLEIAALLAELGHFRCDLLPYNPAGIEKRRTIGMEIPQILRKPLCQGEEFELTELFRERLKQRPARAA